MPWKIWLNRHARPPRYLICDCVVCALKWKAKDLKLPIRCPKCQSPRWNDPTYRRTPYSCVKCQYKWESTLRHRPRKCPSCFCYNFEGKPRLPGDPKPTPDAMGHLDPDQTLPGGDTPNSVAGYVSPYPEKD